MSRFAITAADVVMADRVLLGATVVVEDEHIAAIDPETTAADDIVDGRGWLLVPGLVDLHCDALEKIVEPRGGVEMPQLHIMPQAERLYAGAGITTIYHAISYADRDLGVRNLETSERMAGDLRSWRAHQVIDHRLHARCEVSDAVAFPVLERLLDAGALDLLSVMDHSPGQGQFRSMEAFVGYYTSNELMTAEAATAVGERKQADRDAGWHRALHLLERAHGLGVATASHDDDSPQRVRMLAERGVTISEFPIDLATAATAREAGLCTVLGAPNLVRGSSQSGNMKARDALAGGVLDALCSDYVPWTMLAGALAAPELVDAIDLPGAVALVSRNPARAAGLGDRGEIAVGKRADLALVAAASGRPVVTTTWAAGRLAHRVDLNGLSPWPRSIPAGSAP